MEREAPIVVRVKEFDQLKRLGLVRRVVVVVAQEVQQVVGANSAASIAINALEGRVGRKAPDIAEALPAGFETPLSIADSDEQVLEAMFRVVAEEITVHLEQKGALNSTFMLDLLVKCFWKNKI